MINLKRLKLNNFLSHADTELVFSDSTKLLIDGKSGNGKSAIPEALIWALYGEARTDSRNLVKHGEKTASVEVELVDEATGKVYKIKRKTTTAAKNSLSILESVDGSPFTASQTLGIKDSQNFIEKELLHASYELFINSVAIPQDNVNSFVKQTASKRKDLLLEIANVGDFNEYYEKAKELLKKKDDDLIKKNSAIEQKELVITTQKLLVVDRAPIEKEIAEIDKNIAGHTTILQDIEKTQNAIKEKTDRAWELKSIIGVYEGELLLEQRRVKRVEDDIRTIRSINVSEMEKEVSTKELMVKELVELETIAKSDYERQNLLNSILADRPSDRDYEAEISLLNSKLKPLEQEGQSCPSGANCPFIKPIQNQIAFLVEQIQDKQKKRDDLEKAKGAYQSRLLTVGPEKMTAEGKKRLSDLKVETKTLPRLQNDLANAMVSIMSILTKEADIKEIQAQISSKETLIKTNKEKLVVIEEELKNSDVNTTTQMYEGVKKDIKNLENQKDGLKNTISKSSFAEKIVKDMENEIKDLQKEIKYASIEVEELNLIKDAFGSKGLKTVVVDYLIPRLEERINEILSKLSDFTVRLDTQKTSASGEGTIEGLYINITNPHGQETGFDSFSGGEKVKITIAISEALASLQKCGFRILDEAVIALDKESTESLVKVLDQVQDRFSQMMCISHLDEVKDIFENKIEVVKINGTSTIQ